MKKTIALLLAGTLMVCLFGCSSNTPSAQSSDPMAGVSLEDIDVNTTDFKRASWEFPNMPAIIEHLRDGGWVSTREHAIDYERIFEDLYMFDADKGHDGHLYDLEGEYKDFPNVTMGLFASPDKDKLDFAYTYIAFHSPEYTRYKIDEDGDVYSETTDREVGYLIDPSVTERLDQELKIRQEYIPDVIGYGEQDAFELLEKIGIPRNSLVDVKQVYWRSPGTSIIPALTGEPSYSEEFSEIWSGQGQYGYRMYAIYVGNGYPIAVELEVNQGYAITKTKIEQSELLDASEYLGITTPNSSVSVSFRLDGEHTGEIASNLSPYTELSETPFTDNDTYPFDFTEVDKLESVL